MKFTQDEILDGIEVLRNVKSEKALNFCKKHNVHCYIQSNGDNKHILVENDFETGLQEAGWATPDEKPEDILTEYLETMTDQDLAGVRNDL